MGKRKLGALEKVEADLINLQHKVRRDPASYREDFLAQHAQFLTQLEIFLQNPSTATSAGIVSLRDLIDFVAHVSGEFPKKIKEFPNQLIDLLSRHHAVLEPELREKIVGSLLLLRKKDLVDSIVLMQGLFPILISTPSKSLRTLLFEKILADLRNSNAKTKNHKLNRTVQVVLHNLLTSDRASAKGIWAVKITRELWKRQIWTDAKAVDLMKEACLADDVKVVTGGVRFFLGGDKEREELADESSEDESMSIGQIKHQMGINKKTKKKSRMLDNAVAAVKRKERKKKQPHVLNFSAFHLLHDPQSFAEDLFAKHLQGSKSRLNLEQKLLVLQLVSRLVGLHQLEILNLYSYFLKYLTPRQPSVTTFLACLAQASHRLTPPDELEPLIQKIANEFVSEAVASEVASAGLNAIREVCVRQPLAMNDTLLQDLVMYKKSKDKGVMMAAKGLLSLYRDVGASMLKKRDRGKEVSMSMKKGGISEQRFGEMPSGEIEGLELLAQWMEDERLKKEANGEDGEGEDDEDGWEVDEDESDDSGGWIAVSSDEEVIEDVKKPSKAKKQAVKPSKDEDEDDGWQDAGSGSDEIEIPSDDEDAEEGLDGEGSEDGEDEEPEEIDSEDELEEASDVEDDSDEVENEEPPTKKPRQITELDPDENKENTPILTEDTATKLRNLAMTRILTPADLAKLQELRLAASINKALPVSQRRKMAKKAAELAARHKDDPLTAAEIEGLATLSHKNTRAEKMALAAEGKGDRNEHKSTASIRHSKKLASGKSTTNKEKSRKKNFMMTLGKARQKNKMSLYEKGKVLRAHKAREKSGGRRRNGMKR